jgi:hypothetical protein
MMGHIIPGRFPNTQPWSDVLALLESPDLSAPAVAQLTLLATERRLLQLRGDPSLTYCFWLLTRLATAARGPDFVGDAAQLGIAFTPRESALQLITRVTDRARIELNGFPESGPFGEIASLALRSALMETVGQTNRSLLGSSVDDLERAFRRHSTASQFGELTQRFFGAFMGRTLRFYVERELMHVVGLGGLQSIAEAGDFSDALDRHARQTARIVEEFGAAWYSKQRWQHGDSIVREQVQGFVAHALTKLRKELARGGSQ